MEHQKKSSNTCSFYQQLSFMTLVETRCSSVVRAFTHGVMGHRINPSWWTHLVIFPFSQYSMTGVTKAMDNCICYIYIYILSVGMVHIKDALLPIEKSSPCSCRAGFLSHYPLPYIRCHITINKSVECVVK